MGLGLTVRPVAGFLSWSGVDAEEAAEPGVDAAETSLDSEAAEAATGPGLEAVEVAVGTVAVS